jgi:hypothetical protein
MCKRHSSDVLKSRYEATQIAKEVKDKPFVLLGGKPLLE